MRSGGTVRVKSNRGSFMVEAVPDPGVPRGSLSLALNAGAEGGPSAGELIDATAAVTDVRVETP
jgi:anaerobic selenocysteine-containing dehydrogenase